RAAAPRARARWAVAAASPGRARAAAPPGRARWAVAAASPGRARWAVAAASRGRARWAVAAASRGRARSAGPRRAAALLALAARSLAPAAAVGHAALVRTAPSASGLVTPAPREVVLTFSEPVEARFAAVSISNAAGERVSAGGPVQREGDATTLA